MPLGPSATCGDYVKDFVHSKNKIFSGDSKKKRIRRALGACYKRKNEAMNERMRPDDWKAGQKDFRAKEERAQIKYKHQLFKQQLKQEKKVKVKKEETQIKEKKKYDIDARPHWSVGDTVHMGFGAKGGAGIIGKVAKIDATHTHVTNSEGKTWKGPHHFITNHTPHLPEETINEKLRLMKHIKLAGKDHIKKKTIDRWAPHKQDNPNLGNYKTESEINELNPPTLYSYTKKAIKSVKSLDLAPQAGSLKKYFRKRDNRMKGIQRATERLSKNEEDEMGRNKKKGKLLYLIRHGETAMNNADNSIDRIRGWQDIPLNDAGKVQAHKTGESLKGKGICAIVSSDLVRAAETAKIIGKILGLTPTYTKELRPWHLGDLQGKRTEDCLHQISAHVATPDKKVKGGESFNQFKNRGLKGVENALKVCDGPVAIVTHHRIERLMTAWTKSGQNNANIDPKIFDKKGEKPGEVIPFNMTNYTTTLKPINEAEVKVKVKVKVKTGEGKEKKVKVTQEDKYLTLKDIFDTGEDDGTVL